MSTFTEMELEREPEMNPEETGFKCVHIEKETYILTTINTVFGPAFNLK